MSNEAIQKCRKAIAVRPTDFVYATEGKFSKTSGQALICVTDLSMDDYRHVRNASIHIVLDNQRQAGPFRLELPFENLGWKELRVKLKDVNRDGIRDLVIEGGLAMAKINPSYQLTYDGASLIDWFRKKYTQTLRLGPP